MFGHTRTQLFPSPHDDRNVQHRHIGNFRAVLVLPTDHWHAQLQRFRPQLTARRWQFECNVPHQVITHNAVLTQGQQRHLRQHVAADSQQVLLQAIQIRAPAPSLPAASTRCRSSDHRPGDTRRPAAGRLLGAYDLCILFPCQAAIAVHFPHFTDRIIQPPPTAGVSHCVTTTTPRTDIRLRHAVRVAVVIPVHRAYSVAHTFRGALPSP